MPTNLVQEIQGLYGPFTLSERVLQKIWLRQDFAKDQLRTNQGQLLEVKDPGRWNFQEGPDFKEACLLIDGEAVQGDVEVHFSVSDWLLHDHQSNPNFDQVVLHVVLHTPEASEASARTSRGAIPALLSLLPILEHDLEAYATDEALLALEQVDDLEWVAHFLELSLAERVEKLNELALVRWRQKLKFATKRLLSVGWDEACHQFCLEVLGYARNRAPMARLALEYPLAAFRSQSLGVDRLYGEQIGKWRLNGLRPANHPLKRLEQYSMLIERHPQWPQALKHTLRQINLASGLDTTANVRQALNTYCVCDQLRLGVFSGILSASRFHTLMVDAFLPLATAAGQLDGVPLWMHWWPGDVPEGLERFLKQAQVTTQQQARTNGLLQGALALFLERGTEVA